MEKNVLVGIVGGKLYSGTCSDVAMNGTEETHDNIWLENCTILIISSHNRIHTTQICVFQCHSCRSRIIYCVWHSEQIFHNFLFHFLYFLLYFFSKLQQQDNRSRWSCTLLYVIFQNKGFPSVFWMKIEFNIPDGSGRRGSKEVDDTNKPSTSRISRRLYK